MGQYAFDPQTYLEAMRAEVPDYDELQGAVVAATAGVAAQRVLDLGVGTGETGRRVLAAHPSAELVGIDESAGMIELATAALDGTGARLRRQRLQDPLPVGPFDLVVTAFAVHHLVPAEKQDLFARVRGTLGAGGRFVMADVVVPDDAADAVTPLDPEHDRPDGLVDLLTWLRVTDLTPSVTWARRDLVVVACEVAPSH